MKVLHGETEEVHYSLHSIQNHMRHFIVQIYFTIKYYI
jgi:hypothetical protein